jgi:hypothetical protein
LTVTLALLQEQVAASPSILGMTRTSDYIPGGVFPIEVSIGEAQEKQSTVLLTHPNVELLNESSLENRIWNFIQHRWLAFYLLEHIFREDNVVWSHSNALIYSFQMMTPCAAGRYEYLSPLVGYCLQFSSLQSIQSRATKLREIWKDPSLFLPYGNTCLTQFSLEDQAGIIITCFKDVHSYFSTKHKQVSYNRDHSWLKRWRILSACIFKLWLKATSSNNLKSSVDDAFVTITTTTKPTTTTITTKPKRKAVGCPSSPSKLPPPHPKKPHVPRHPSENGYASIPSSGQGPPPLQVPEPRLESTRKDNGVERNKFQPGVTVHHKPSL